MRAGLALLAKKRANTHFQHLPHCTQLLLARQKSMRLRCASRHTYDARVSLRAKFLKRMRMARRHRESAYLFRRFIMPSFLLTAKIIHKNTFLPPAYSKSAAAGLLPLSAISISFFSARAPMKRPKGRQPAHTHAKSSPLDTLGHRFASMMPGAVFHFDYHAAAAAVHHAAVGQRRTPLRLPPPSIISPAAKTALATIYAAAATSTARKRRESTSDAGNSEVLLFERCHAVKNAEEMIDIIVGHAFRLRPPIDAIQARSADFCC